MCMHQRTVGLLCSSPEIGKILIRITMLWHIQILIQMILGERALSGLLLKVV
jgi:hypothetical protein